MRSWIHLDKSALVHNFQLFREVAGSAQVIAVLKSNAYGHGIKEVWQALEEQNPRWIGVNYLYEAAQLRDLGCRSRLLVMGPIAPDSLEEAASLNVDLVLSAPELMDAWILSPHKPAAHVKFDTGMSRLGFSPEDAGAIAQRLLPHHGLVAGILSHFANVEDVTEHNYAQQQLERFEAAKRAFADAGLRDLLAHIASSASALLLESSRYHLVRIGISLYGQWPSQATRLSFLQRHSRLLDLKPALEWRTEIANLRPVKAGAFVGYGCTFRANHDMLVAILPVGYFEGYPRLASTGAAYVLVNGQRCPIVGRICMNMMMVEVTHVSNLKSGNPVTLIGTDGDEYLSAGQLAEWSQTINYEILSRINPNITRILKPSSNS